MLLSLSLSLSLFLATSKAAPADVQERQITNLVSAYAPNALAACPSDPLIRTANGLHPGEAAFVAARKPKATGNLKSFLSRLDAGFPVLANAQYPTLSLIDGGGGLRGFLICAGIHQAFDKNEPTKHATAGLYQAMTYEVGLSGSADSLASYFVNNWPLTSNLTSQLWSPAFQSGIVKPRNGDPTALTAILADVTAKQTAGYEVTINDAWARLLSYATLTTPNYGAGSLLSDLPTLTGYTTATRPYPIITALGVEVPKDGCGLPPKNASQYEFTPHEFGSWEEGIQSFMTTKYIGTKMNGGSPSLITCTTGFDNAGWIMATSTNTFNQQCGDVRNRVNEVVAGDDVATVRSIVQNLLGTGIRSLYSIMPNPFFGLTTSPRVSSLPNLMLVDGGENIQVPPIWPMLYRDDVSVLFISDNSADNPSNYAKTGDRINLPSGIQLFNTYTQAKLNGIANRMPFIPAPKVFQAKGLNKRALTIFGCNEDASSLVKTFIYLPNRPIVFNSSQSASRLQYDSADTAGMIANGIAIATNNGDPGFATCLGCATMKRAALKAGKSLPSACTSCFTKYCYN